MYVLSHVTNTPVFNLAKILIYLYRAQTRRIKRVAGKKFWAKRKRDIYSRDYQRNVRFEEGVVHDMWVHPASYHEVKSVRIRYQKSLWFRALADSLCLMGDRGYRGLGLCCWV